MSILHVIFGASHACLRSSQVLTIGFFLSAIVLVLVNILVKIWIWLGITVDSVRSEIRIVLIKIVHDLVKVPLPCIWRCLLHSHLPKNVIYRVLIQYLIAIILSLLDYLWCLECVLNLEVCSINVVIFWHLVRFVCRWSQRRIMAFRARVFDMLCIICVGHAAIS